MKEGNYLLYTRNYYALVTTKIKKNIVFIE